MKRTFSLVAVLAVAAATAFAAVGYAGSNAATTTTVKVTIKNFHFTLSKHSARHGKVTFVVTNKDKIKHDFKIAGKKTPLLKKGQTKSITVTLKKGKKYTYICTVPGHAAAGMKGTFKAT
ncbi:MAG TPA: cupredoxin domain-containing protein [Gaiellaceae bacterium]|nr:cupredoxin domain-containing protein [Gaiellaceae bacterium]